MEREQPHSQIAELTTIAREFLTDFGHRYKMPELVDSNVRFQLAKEAKDADGGIRIKLFDTIKIHPRGQMRSLVESMELGLSVARSEHNEFSAIVRLSYDHGDGTNGHTTSYRLIVEKDSLQGTNVFMYRHFVKHRHYVMMITQHNQKMETLKKKENA